MTPEELERFESKICYEPMSGCWLWTSSLGGRSPFFYGRFYLRGGNRMAHLVAYEHWVGPIPEGLQVDHLCRQRRCVNPDHLEAVTARVNLLRSECVSAVNARKTHCVHGHPLRGQNVYVRRNGHRRCKTCHMIRCRGYRAASKEAQ